MTLTTLGLTGPQWITRLEKNGYRVSSYAKDILNSPEYKPMEKGQKLEVAFVTVKDMGKQYATTAEIKAYAAAEGYEIPSPEIALLMREALSDKEIEDMGVWHVAALHEPIKDSDGGPDVLDAYRGGGGRWVGTYWDNPDDRWNAGGAFAFVVPASTSKLDSSPKPLSALTLISEIEEKLADLKKLV